MNRGLLFSALVSTLLAPAVSLSAAIGASASGPNLLIVGGGPDRRDNQVAIESNVRYVAALSRGFPWVRVLFGDGEAARSTVSYLDSHGHTKHRAAHLPRLDGPSSPEGFGREIDALENRRGEALLYFTGHGASDDKSNYLENGYCYWGDEYMIPRDLADEIAKLPAKKPVVIVMVQCFSGAFANVLFEHADPKAKPVARDIAGFFASLKMEEAAGCTDEVDEAYYHDFTSYFFAALTGRDRLGRTVTGADYNGDGKVGMDEAFEYSMALDSSIDTPTCTSYIYLQRKVDLPSSDLDHMSYSDVVAWASPGQRFAMNTLSAKLGLYRDDRLSTLDTYIQSWLEQHSADDLDETTAKQLRLLTLAGAVIRAHRLLANGPPDEVARYRRLLVDEAQNPFMGTGIHP